MKGKINLSRSLILKAAVRPEMVVSHPEMLRIIIAELQLFIHSLKQPFNLTIGGGAMNFGANVFYSSSLAPPVKLGMAAV